MTAALIAGAFALALTARWDFEAGMGAGLLAFIAALAVQMYFFGWQP